MGFLTILRKIREKEKEVRILVLGLDNAGKTTAVHQLCQIDIDTIEPTLGFRIHTLLYDEYTLHLWDVGGQATIRAYWRNYFENVTEGIVWVVDATDPRQCEEFTTVLQHLPDASLLVLANKQDCDGARSVEDVTTELGLSCEKERHWHVQACSAKTGAGLDEGIRWLMEDIGSRLCQH